MGFGNFDQLQNNTATLYQYRAPFMPIARTSTGEPVLAEISYGVRLGLSWDKGSTWHHETIFWNTPFEWDQEYNSNAVFLDSRTALIPEAAGEVLTLRTTQVLHRDEAVYYEVEVVHDGNPFSIGFTNFADLAYTQRSTATDLNGLAAEMPATPPVGRFADEASPPAPDMVLLRSDGTLVVSQGSTTATYTVTQPYAPFATTGGTTTLRVAYMEGRVWFGTESGWMTGGGTFDITTPSAYIVFQNPVLVVDVTGTGTPNGVIKLRQLQEYVYDAPRVYTTTLNHHCVRAPLLCTAPAVASETLMDSQDYPNGTFDVGDGSRLGVWITTGTPHSRFSDDYGYTWKPSKIPSSYSQAVSFPWFLWYAGNGCWYAHDYGEWNNSVDGGVGDKRETTGFFRSTDNLVSIDQYQPNGMFRNGGSSSSDTPAEDGSPHYLQVDGIFGQSILTNGEFLTFHTAYVVDQLPDENNGIEYDIIWRMSPDLTDAEPHTWFTKWNGSRGTPFDRRDYEYFGMWNSPTATKSLSINYEFEDETSIAYTSTDGFKTWEASKAFQYGPIDWWSYDRSSYNATYGYSNKNVQLGTIADTALEYYHGTGENHSYKSDTLSRNPTAYWTLGATATNGVFSNEVVGPDLVITDTNYDLSPIGPIRNGPPTGIRLRTLTQPGQFLYIDNTGGELNNTKTIEMWVKYKTATQFMGQFSGTPWMMYLPMNVLGNYDLQNTWAHFVITYSDDTTLTDTNRYMWYLNGYQGSSIGVPYTLCRFVGKISSGLIHLGRPLNTSPTSTTTASRLAAMSSDGFEIAEIAMYESMFTRDDVAYRLALARDYYGIREE